MIDTLGYLHRWSLLVASLRTDLKGVSNKGPLTCRRRVLALESGLGPGVAVHNTPSTVSAKFPRHYLCIIFPLSDIGSESYFLAPTVLSASTTCVTRGS